MTEPFNSFVQRGGGQLSWRLSIEGFKYEAVTARGMEGTMPDGKVRTLGLNVEGVKLTQNANPITAKIEAGGTSFKFTDLGGAWTAAFNTEPANITWLSPLSMSLSGTTMDVLSTEGWPYDGYLHVNQEAMSYVVTSPTSFFVSRGKWGSQQRAHWNQIGTDTRFLEITSNPVVLEGRRVYLYAYTEGDDPQGDGTLVWQGIAAGEPKMSGPEWSLLVDSLVSILDSELGADIEDPVTPRGIYYPGSTTGAREGRSWGQFEIYIWESTDAYIPTFVERVGVISSMAINSSKQFFATTAELVAEINLQIAAAVAASPFEFEYLQCVEDANDQYHFEFKTGATSPKGISVFSFVTPDVGEIEAFFDKDNLQVYSGDTAVLFVGASSVYRILPNRLAAPIPRGVFGYSARPPGANGPLGRLYLDGAAPVDSNLNAAQVDINGETLGGFISARSSITNYIDVAIRDYRDDLFKTYTGNAPPSIKLTRIYNSDSAGGFATWGLLDELTRLTPEEVNKGSQPAILPGDWEGGTTEYWREFYLTAPDWLRVRTYTVSEAVPLSDLVCPDLQLAAHFLSLTYEGKLTIKPIRFASKTERIVYRINRKNLIGMPSWEKMPAGNFSSMIIRDNWDAGTEKYLTPPLMPQDVSSLGRRGGRRAIEIKAKSTARGVGGTGGIPILDAISLADKVLGIYGHPYAYVTCQIPLTGWIVTSLGSPVSISTHLLPSGLGVRGVENLNGIVLSREIIPHESKINITILVSLRDIYGYAAEALIDGITVDGLDCIFELDPSFFAEDDLAENHFEPGDRIYAYRFDSDVYDFRYGTVTSVSGNTVNTTMDAAFDEGPYFWILSFSWANDSATDNQKLYCYLASSDGMIPFTTAKPAAKLNSGE